VHKASFRPVLGFSLQADHSRSLFRHFQQNYWLANLEVCFHWVSGFHKKRLRIGHFHSIKVEVDYLLPYADIAIGIRILQKQISITIEEAFIRRRVKIGFPSKPSPSKPDADWVDFRALQLWLHFVLIGQNHRPDIWWGGIGEVLSGKQPQWLQTWSPKTLLYFLHHSRISICNSGGSNAWIIVGKWYKIHHGISASMAALQWKTLHLELHIIKQTGPNLLSESRLWISFRISC